MKALKYLLIATLIVAMPTFAFGRDGPGPIPDIPYDITVGSAAFTTIAMNTARTTDEIRIGGFRFATFFLTHVNDSATDILMSCTGRTASGGTDYAIQALDYSAGSGVATSYDASWTKAVTGNKNWSWRVNLFAYEYLVCTFTATSGAVADKLSVTAIMSVD